MKIGRCYFETKQNSKQKARCVLTRKQNSCNNNNKMNMLLQLLLFGRVPVCCRRDVDKDFSRLRLGWKKSRFLAVRRVQKINRKWTEICASHWHCIKWNVYFPLRQKRTKTTKEKEKNFLVLRIFEDFCFVLFCFYIRRPTTSFEINEHFSKKQQREKERKFSTFLSAGTQKTLAFRRPAAECKNQSSFHLDIAACCSF